MANLCALTALNNMYTILGSGGAYNASAAGVASQKLAGGVARYLDCVGAQHTPKDFGDEDDSEGDEGGDGEVSATGTPGGR